MISSSLSDVINTAHILQDSKACRVVLDGFFVETLLFTVIGLLWFYWGKKQIRQLEAMEPSSWIVNQKSSTAKDIELCNAENWCW